jgi:TATA-binding protein-associated factor
VIDILANDVAYVGIRLGVSYTYSSALYRLPLSTLATTLFPFFRHTISNVRLAVVKTLDSFMTVPTLPREWISTPFLCLLLQNLICEERVDIRDISLAAWERALSILSADPQKLEATVDQGLILNWYAIMMTPIGLPIDTTNFYRPYVAVENSKAPERHNVDKNMLAQDLSLVSMETIFQARITAAKAMAELMLRWRMEVRNFPFLVNSSPR